MRTEALETLQSTLLIFSVLVLGWILYRRLLDALGRKQAPVPVVRLDEVRYDRASGDLVVEAVLPQPQPLVCTLITSSGGGQVELLREEKPAGNHRLVFPMNALVPGKYRLELVSGSAAVTRFFEV